PAVLELGAVGIHGPAAHLDAGVHVPVEHEARPAARALQPADRLARALAGLGGMRDLHHLDREPGVRHVAREVVGQRALFERGAGDADRRLLEGEDLTIADPLGDALPRAIGSHGSTFPRRARRSLWP